MAESNISDMYLFYDCSNNGNEDIQNEEQTKSTGDKTISIKKKRKKIF